MSSSIALFGHPVAHSRSPAMMRAAFKALSLDVTYTAIDLPPEGLGPAVAALRALRALGANVTVPYKVRVCALLDYLDPSALAIGAVNTIARRGGSLVGYNTDAHGITQSFEDASVSLVGARVLVFGAGGAARAAVVGCALARARDITVVSRDAARAGEVARLADIAPETSHRGLALGSMAARDALGAAEVIVQATPCGMLGGPTSQALLAHLDLGVCAPHAVALDLVYNPRDTDFLRVCGTRGLLCLDGIGPLVHQGALALALWFGSKAPVKVMREAISG